MANEPLILDLLEWIASKPRSYDAVMAAWRTSCPQLTIWEDAVEQYLVKRERHGAAQAMVRVTQLGRERLLAAGRASPMPPGDHL